MQTRIIATGLLLVLLAACSPTTPMPLATATPQPTLAPTSEPDSDACPTETADLQLFTNTADGYCLLYPTTATALPPYLIVINPTGQPGDMPGDAWVQISVEAAAGRTAAEVAEGQIAEAGTGFNITRSEILIAGQPAVVVDGLPGPDPWRKVFIVAHDRLYTLFFLPWSPSSASFAQLEALYTTVIASFHVLPPTP